MSKQGRTRYEFGSAAEDSTVVLGLRVGQLAVLATCLVVGVGLVRISGSHAAFLAAACLVGAGAGLAFWPIAGRTIEQWAPVLARWTTLGLRGQRRWRSGAAEVGQNPQGEVAQRPPPPLRGVRIIPATLDGTDTQVGVVHDRRANTYAAVLAVRGQSFQLADTPDRQRRLAAWGGVLAGLARASSPIHRLQWVERTVPEDGDAMGRYLREAIRVPREHPTLASYLELVDRAGPTSPQHETFLVVAISAAKARRAIRQAGGAQAGATKVLLREVVALHRQLTAADVLVDGILTPRLLASAVRTAFDPGARAKLARRAAAATDEPGTGPGNAWPLTSDTTWSAYRTEDVWHTTYWIAQWPRTPVGADFLTPLLLGQGGLRSIAVTLEPVSPLLAHRQVEHDVLKSQADEDLRTQAGFATTARHRRAQETVARREQELADGHADYRLAGYVTVTASTPEELEVRCGEIEQAAQQCFLELRRMHGEQDAAFAFTLPLARGLR